MAVLLAALSALTFGVSDFYGGIAARRTVVYASTAVAQVSGLVALLVIAGFAGGSPGASDWGWGFAAGVVSGCSILLFYWSLSAGQMSVVAPVAAVMSAVVPVVAGLAQGERPSVIALIGIAVALPAIVLISREPSAPDDGPDEHGTAVHRPRRLLSAPVAAALVAGTGFGLFFVAIANAGDDSGMWPLVGARLVGMLIVLALASVRRAGRPSRDAVGPAVIAGTLEALANGLFVVASRVGLLSLVGVVGALYPASTVVLAQKLLGERMARHQKFGLVLAAMAVVAVGLAS